MTKAHSDQFEMRRLESLSNTIFGVAMTLLAYGLPQAAQFDHAPNWADLYHAFGGRLVGLVMSFVVAGVFWFSHNRRLARQPWGGRWGVMLNLMFLLSIVLLPVTNGPYGMSSTIAMLYGLHLTAIGGLNALLWRLAAGPGFSPELAASVFPLLMFIPGTAVAAISPKYAIYCWLLAFGGLFVSRLFNPRADEA